MKLFAVAAMGITLLANGVLVRCTLPLYPRTHFELVRLLYLAMLLWILALPVLSDRFVEMSTVPLTSNAMHIFDLTVYFALLSQSQANCRTDNDCDFLLGAFPRLCAVY